MTADHALRVERLSAGYGNRRVLQAVTLPACARGTVTALVGPNGAGKSTLLRALARLLPADGTVRLAGVDLLHASIAEHAEAVAFMPQAIPQGVHLTVFEAVLSAMNAATPESWLRTSRESRERVVTLLERVDMARYAHRALDELSGGERQLASLAQALVRDPRVLLLDEPTSALDLRHQVSVMSLIRDLSSEGRIVIVVVHDLNLAVRWADRVVVLDEGQVAATGTPDAALTPDVLARIYGVQARVERCSQGRAHVLVDGLLDRTARIAEEPWPAAR